MRDSTAYIGLHARNAQWTNTTLAMTICQWHPYTQKPDTRFVAGKRRCKQSSGWMHRSCSVYSIWVSLFSAPASVRCRVFAGACYAMPRSASYRGWGSVGFGARSAINSASPAFLSMSRSSEAAMQTNVNIREAWRGTKALGLVTGFGHFQL